MKITYNPLVASSIMLAVLTALYLKENGENFQLQASLTAEIDAFKFFKENQMQGKTPASVFNSKQAPHLLLAVSENHWEAAKKAKVQSMILLKYGVLTDAKLADLSMRMTAQPSVQAAYIDKLCDWADNLIDSPILALIDTPANHTRVVSNANRWYKENAPKEEQLPTQAPEVV
jgi:hypothetical protein